MAPQDRLAFTAGSSFQGKRIGQGGSHSSQPAIQPQVITTAVASKPVTDAPKPRKLSRVEGLKTQSSQLRFPLVQELANDQIFITEDAVQIMKFHGSYQQDDREQRKKGQQKKYQFMLRLKMPSGEFPSSLYQVLDELSTNYGNNTLRATTRCAWQMHGVFKGDLKTVFSSIMNAGGSCIGACGDLSRNVMCTPAPFTSKQYSHARFIARMMGELFAPQTGAFSEIWLDGEKAASLEFWKQGLDMNEVDRVMRYDNGNGVVFSEGEEPIYGETYLPRKFKIGVTVPGDNSIDIYTQDIGIVCIFDDAGDAIGYNIMVGGGMGRTHNKETTFARTADHLGFVAADKLYEACKAIVAAQRDHGNRSVRANARMKYLVDKMGIDDFRKLVEGYFGQKFEPYKELPPWKYEDWLGWYEQGDGNLFLGLFVEHGRIKDEGTLKLKTALRRIADVYHFDMVVSPNQNIFLKGIAPSQRDAVIAILQEHGVKLPEEYDANRRLAMACPALPLCGLAVTEAERHMPGVVTRMNELFARHGITVPITMRMTGCPNGCARPYMAEIGFVGDGPLSYQIWLGGCSSQTRLAWPYLNRVKDADLESTLEPILQMYMQQANSPSEAFGDFCHRVGKDAIVAFSENLKARGGQTTSLEGNGAAKKRSASVEASPAGSSAASMDIGETEVADVPQKRAKSESGHRPRLTVSNEIMQRLKNIGAHREMSASQVADELLNNYLSGIEEEDLTDEVE